MRSLSLALVLVLCAPAAAGAQSIEGVWKPVETVISGGQDAGRHTDDIQPGLLIFTRSHYSTVVVTGFTARPGMSANPTNEERGRIWTPFTANAGSYTTRDSTLSYTPAVAKNPRVMSGETFTTRFRVRGDSLWFTTTSAAGVTTVVKWIRVERLPAGGAPGTYSRVRIFR